MITFWLVCGILIVIALAFVLPPLFQNENVPGNDQRASADANVAVYKDQLAELETELQNGLIGSEQYEQDRTEIQRRMLADVSDGERGEVAVGRSRDIRVAYMLAIALPALAVTLYLRLGNTNARPAAPDVSQTSIGEARGASGPPGAMSQAQIESNVAALAKRLETNPSDLQGWTMLARSYGILEKYPEASKAYEKAVALKPGDAELITNYAFALAMANQGKFEGRPQELIKQALQIDPENTNTLGLAGGAAFEQKDYKQAIAHWTKLLAHVPPESDIAQAVSKKLEEAKSLAGKSSGN